MSHCPDGSVQSMGFMHQFDKSICYMRAAPACMNSTTVATRILESIKIWTHRCWNGWNGGILATASKFVEAYTGFFYYWAKDKTSKQGMLGLGMFFNTCFQWTKHDTTDSTAAPTINERVFSIPAASMATAHSSRLDVQMSIRVHCSWVQVDTATLFGPFLK